MKKTDLIRTKIFDGFESDLFQKDFNLNIQDTEINFIANDITANKLSGLTELNLIINSIEVVITEFGYLSKDRLQLYYLKSKGLLLIFSFGEYQPTRYMLYIESVWEL